MSVDRLPGVTRYARPSVTERVTHADTADALMQAVPPQQRSLLVALIARSFLEMYAAAYADVDPSSLVAWADRMCDAHSETPAVASFFAHACSHLVTTAGFGTESHAERAMLAALEPALRAVAAKPRRSAPKPQHHVDEIDAAINGAIFRLERADPLSAEHSRAVSAWCARLARRMSLSDEDVVHVARCGLIHDVGKITTPADVLHAPRALTQAEWVVMRNHAAAGHAIVLQDPLLAAFASSVRSHHERLDGKGYPDNLRAGDISLFTRIVTVADCFNAMIGRRPYRLPMPPETAIEQLKTHSDTQFDRDIVTAMLDLV